MTGKRPPRDDDDRWPVRRKPPEREVEGGDDAAEIVQRGRIRNGSPPEHDGSYIARALARRRRRDRLDD